MCHSDTILVEYAFRIRPFAFLPKAVQLVREVFKRSHPHASSAGRDFMIPMTMSSQLPAGPSVPAYGGRGSCTLTIAWTEAAVSLVLMLLRTYTNMFIVNSFRREYYWVLITLVRRPFQPCSFRN